MSHIYSKSTVSNGVLLARAYEEILTGSSSNTYVGLGKSSEWENGEVTLGNQSIEEFNLTFRNLLVLKKIYASDVNLVVPDIRWQEGGTYDQFNSDEDMYSHINKVELVGRIDYTAGSNVITGNTLSTAFTSDLSIGDIIEFPALTEQENYIRKEIVYITNNYHAIINTSLSSSFTDNTIHRIDSTYPRYAKRFYVRNREDQVFLCLFNNGGTPSNTEPVFTSPYSTTNIIDDTPDGYVWRYLYTVPLGLAEKFFYTDREDVRWVPVTTDNDIVSTVLDGSIEHVRIINSGTLYNSNTPSSSADIITVNGDGENASFTAVVESSVSNDNKTVISNLLTANIGSGYTYATITAAGGDGSAEFKALISPPDGFGYDPAKDLGAKFLGISVEFSGTVSDTLPVSTSIGATQFRQACIVANPKYSANSQLVNLSAVSMTANISVSYIETPSIGDDFLIDGEVVGTVTGFISGDSPTILINNLTRSLQNNDVFTIGTSSAGGLISNINYLPPIKRSGDILYVENFDVVARDLEQVEVIKLILKF